MLLKKWKVEKYDSHLKNKKMEININFWSLFVVRFCFNSHRQDMLWSAWFLKVSPTKKEVNSEYYVVCEMLQKAPDASHKAVYQFQMQVTRSDAEDWDTLYQKDRGCL